MLDLTISHLNLHDLQRMVVSVRGDASAARLPHRGQKADTWCLLGTCWSGDRQIVLMADMMRGNVGGSLLGLPASRRKLTLVTSLAPCSYCCL
jgi:hypothetical protein